MDEPRVMQKRRIRIHNAEVTGFPIFPQDIPGIQNIETEFSKKLKKRRNKNKLAKATRKQQRTKNKK